MADTIFACTECGMVIPDKSKTSFNRYAAMLKVDLVQKVGERGLNKVGKKEELVARLIKSDYESLEIEELLAKLTELNPMANVEGDKEKIISTLMKENSKKHNPTCRLCPSAAVSQDWSGYVVIMNPSRSEIASRLNIKVPGNYALKVNTR
tara:strand:+ start:63 stop:515 length:453 start_codon:yes stop_codon:yes gene_type:complete